MRRATETAHGFEQFSEKVQEVELKYVLIAHRYFSWASQRISHIMYKENVGEIDTNLLSDFFGDRGAKDKKSGK